MTQIKHLLLTMLLMCSIPSMAQWVPTANLTIFSEDGAKFFLVLNGERYNDVAQTNIRIEELPNPYYNCKVIFEDKSLPQISKNALMLTDADGIMQDVTYRIKKDNKGKNVLRFYSFVPAQQNMVRPANCATYRFGAPNMLVGTVSNQSMSDSRMTTTTIQQTTMSPAANVSVNVGGVGMNVNVGAPVLGGAVTTTTTSSGYVDDGFDDDVYQSNNQRPNRGNSNIGRRGGCNMAMNSANFEEAKRTVAKNGFDETRLSTAKQIASSNCLNTNQIASLLKIFSFEESKLDFAKYAYDYCTDRNNYFKVSNSFSFESSKTELNSYVQGMR
jgi:hypothetical protein